MRPPLLRERVRFSLVRDCRNNPTRSSSVQTANRAHTSIIENPLAFVTVEAAGEISLAFVDAAGRRGWGRAAVMQTKAELPGGDEKKNDKTRGQLRTSWTCPKKT